MADPQQNYRNVLSRLEAEDKKEAMDKAKVYLEKRFTELKFNPLVTPIHEVRDHFKKTIKKIEDTEDK